MVVDFSANAKRLCDPTRRDDAIHLEPLLSVPFRDRSPLMVDVRHDRRPVGEANFEAGSTSHRRRRGQNHGWKTVLVEDEIARLEVRHRPPALRRRHGGVERQRLSLQSCHEIVRQPYALERRAEHELARMEDERGVLLDLDELGQVLLLLANVDIGVATVVENSKKAVDPDVHARGLEQRLVVGIDLDPAFCQEPGDRTV